VKSSGNAVNVMRAVTGSSGGLAKNVSYYIDGSGRTVTSHKPKIASGDKLVVDQTL